jgi:hypothetical protein
VSEVAVTMTTKFRHYISLNSPDDRTFSHTVLLRVAMATNITSDEEQYNGNIEGRLLLKMPSVFVSRMRCVRSETRYDCLVVGPVWDVLHLLRCGSLLERRMIREWSHSGGTVESQTMTVCLNCRSEMWIRVFKAEFGQAMLLR